MKVISVLGTAFLLIALEEWLKKYDPCFRASCSYEHGCMLQVKSAASVSACLSEKFGKLWIAAEVILFVLVGAAVDIHYTLEAGLGSVPLSLGLPCENIVLSEAVLSIKITAPLGAFGMDMTYQHLLEKETGSGGNMGKC